MTKLITWAEQVASLAKDDGRDVSDGDVDKGILGASDLIRWLLDSDGEVLCNHLWSGFGIYGGFFDKVDFDWAAGISLCATCV